MKITHLTQAEVDDVVTQIHAEYPELATFRHPCMLCTSVYCEVLVDELDAGQLHAYRTLRAVGRAGM